MARHSVPAEARQLLQAGHSKLEAAPIPVELRPSVGAQIRDDLDGAFGDAYQPAMICAFALAVALAAVGALTSWFVIARPRAQEPASAQPTRQSSSLGYEQALETRRRRSASHDGVLSKARRVV
jgi:hypothetical protein